MSETVKKRGRPKKAEAPASSTNHSNGTQPRQKKLLRDAQVRLLKALAKTKGVPNKRQIEEKAEINPAWSLSHAGRIDPAKRAKAAQDVGFPSLVDLGFAKVRQLDVDGKSEMVWEITAKGRKALESL